MPGHDGPPKRTIDLADGPQVVADLEQRKTTGKMVLVP